MHVFHYLFYYNLENEFKNESSPDFTYITNHVLESDILKHFRKKKKEIKLPTKKYNVLFVFLVEYKFHYNSAIL